MTLNLSANERVRVNVRAFANMAAVRREKRNGRDVVIVPSATMPDDVIMNGVKYPAGEIEASYRSLNRKPAPLGHPLVNGEFVSASDPEGINLGWIGAWNENVYRKDGRVFLDKVIDVARANESEGGQAVLAAIDAGGPVHTSTGLYAIMDAANGEDGCDYVARNIEFDHDAILLDQEGAATPEQGVGMMVNADGQHEKITVINSALENDIERDLGWAVESAVRALERRERLSVTEQILAAIKAIFEGGQETRETSASTGDAEMTDKAQFEELSAKVKALTESAVTKDDLTNAVTEAVKPLLDAQEAAQANQEAKDKADHDALVEKVVNAKIPGFDKDVAEKMDAVALNALLANHEAKPSAAPLASGFSANSDAKDDFSPLATNKDAK
ncbi:MAG: hypothetical protein AAFY81_07865 [Pseudomonadota bacterium]